MKMILYLFFIVNIANIALANNPNNPNNPIPKVIKSFGESQKTAGGPRGGHAPCGLKCFLEKVRIMVPDIQKRVLFSTLYLTDIVCGHMELDNISSTFKEPVTLSVKNIGFGLTCSLNYSWAVFEGNATATASKSSIAGDIEFIKDAKTNLTSSSNFSNGNVIIDVTNVDFSGIFLNWRM